MNTWSSLWQQAESDPYLQTAIALLALNGLTLDQIKHLDQAVIDLEAGWITCHNAVTYPLVSYSRDALSALPIVFESEQWAAAVEILKDMERDAHRRLVGALWVTDPENQVTLGFAGGTEIPLLPLRFTFPFSIAERLQPGEDSEVAVRSRSILQTAADWLIEQTFTPSHSLSQRLMKVMRQGSLVFLVASTGVSGLNLIHNIVMGRLLSPADYSQLTFIITLQLLISLLPIVLQTVVARFSARYQARDDLATLSVLLRRISRFGWMMGGILTIGLFLITPLLVSVFQLTDGELLLPVIIGLPFFVAAGADRGFLQGTGKYFWLSGAYLTEAVIRLVVGAILGFVLLTAQRSLEGAVLGLAQSMVATWFVSYLAMRHFRRADSSVLSSFEQSEWVQLGQITLLALIGQALITNSDFMLVKNFFTSQDAGFYAAVSVLGRIVYFGALPLTIILVPLIARRQALNQPTRPILLLLLGGGVAISMLLILGALVFGDPFITLLYGEAYSAAAGLLAPYALAASLYTLTNLTITYQIALGKGGETWMPLLAGTAQIIGILLFHQTLMQVILVQIVLMSALLAAVLWRVLRVSHVHNQTSYLLLEAAQDIK